MVMSMIMLVMINTIDDLVSPKESPSYTAKCMKSVVLNATNNFVGKVWNNGIRIFQDYLTQL
jgi:hypothetical protein